MRSNFSAYAQWVHTCGRDSYARAHYLESAVVQHLGRMLYKTRGARSSCACTVRCTLVLTTHGRTHAEVEKHGTRVLIMVVVESRLFFPACSPGIFSDRLPLVLVLFRVNWIFLGTLGRFLGAASLSTSLENVQNGFKYIGEVGGLTFLNWVLFLIRANECQILL